MPPFGGTVRALVLMMLCFWPSIPPSFASAPTELTAAWEYVHAWLAAERDTMARDLATAHTVLLARARAAGDEELIEALDIEPPRPRPHGYGILPEWTEDAPLASVETRRNTYSLSTLSTAYTSDFRDASVLAARATDEPDLPLAPWVAEFQRLSDRMQNLEDHLDYHAKWQIEAVAYRKWFARRNRIVDQVAEMVRLEREGAPAAQVERIRREVLGRLAPFRPTPGLRVERRADGLRVLVLDVATDIDDEAFLDAAARAVERAYSDSEAARARRFALEVRWIRVPAASLYPEGVPARGSKLDLDDHVSRFPEGVPLLTTGAESTYAWTGKSVRLGPGELAPRVLAHEFGHLLGFDDAYLRGFEGEPGGTYGAVFVEWVGLRDDLMGNPGGGSVTAPMLDTLFEAYGDPPAAD